MKPIRCLSLTTLMLLCVGMLQAQTVLNPGDIAIVRVNEVNTLEGFSFVTLVPIAAGTVIYFTDEGWAGTAWYGTAEGHFKYTAPAGGLSAGSVVHIDETASGSNTPVATGGGTAVMAWSTASFNFSGGESIIAYQTNEASKPAAGQLTFIAGIMLNDGSSTSETYDATTLWTSSTITIPTSNTCQIPTGLTNGVNCFSMFAGGTEPANANVLYNRTLTSGTRAQLLAAMNNKANWVYQDGTGYATSAVGTFTVTSAVVSFSDGSGFTQSLSAGAANQVLGRFRLTADISGSSLTAASVRLDGTRSGLSNLKLWSSADAVFGGDTQLGSTVAADPGDGNSAAFSGFSGAISTSGTYFFLTGDIAASPSGSTQGILASNSSLTFDSGILSGSITNAVLSNGTSPLPVEMTSFTASSANSGVVLAWHVATEVNNWGFEIERRTINGISPLPGAWTRIGFVRGAGASTSPRDYTFTDNTVTSGTFAYRLKQVDNDGACKYYGEAEATIAAPAEFSLSQNYPNPFNPATTIRYQLPSSGFVTLKVYDMLGCEVATLVHEIKDAGSYAVVFNASELASGLYMYRLQAGDFSATRRFVLVK